MGGVGLEPNKRQKKASASSNIFTLTWGKRAAGVCDRYDA